MELADELDHLSNLCADLVSERRHESILFQLFDDTPTGAWIMLRDLAASGDYPATLAASWVKAPDADYAIVLFFDTDTLWSMHADYNLARLLRSRTPAMAAAAR